MLCPADLTGWTNGTAPVFQCTFAQPDTVKPVELDGLILDPLKFFIVRFYDSSRESDKTHRIWNNVVAQIESEQNFQFMVPYQINCDCDEATRNYCQNERAMKKFPDVVAFKNGKIVDYFKKKHDEFTQENLVDFVSNLGDINPFKEHKDPPEYDGDQCCLIISLTGDMLNGRGEGLYYLQKEPRFGDGFSV